MSKSYDVHYVIYSSIHNTTTNYDDIHCPSPSNRTMSVVALPGNNSILDGVVYVTVTTAATTIRLHQHIIIWYC